MRQVGYLQRSYQDAGQQNIKSPWMHLHENSCLKIYIYIEKLTREFKSHLNGTRITCTLQEDH